MLNGKVIEMMRIVIGLLLIVAFGLLAEDEGVNTVSKSNAAKNNFVENHSFETDTL